MNHDLAQGTGVCAASEINTSHQGVTWKHITFVSLTILWGPKNYLFLSTSSSDPSITELEAWRQHCAKPAAKQQGHSSRLSIQELYTALQRPGNQSTEPLQEAAASDLPCCTAGEVSLQDGGSCSFPSHTTLPRAMPLGGWYVTHHTTFSVCQSLHHIYEDESEHRKWGQTHTCARGRVWPS